MEFLNDRFASMSISYDMNGKLFNRIPLLKNLKWREMFRVRALWGTLTDKNNPFKSSNPDLFRFPTRDGKFTSFVMDPKVPYVEASVGIYTFSSCCMLNMYIVSLIVIIRVSTKTVFVSWY